MNNNIPIVNIFFFQKLWNWQIDINIKDRKKITKKALISDDNYPKGGERTTLCIAQGKTESKCVRLTEARWCLTKI